MQNKKIIATDLDGTLLDINKKCSKETQEYLQKLKQEAYNYIKSCE